MWFPKAKPWSRSAEREIPYRSKAPEGVNFRRKEGEPQVGFPLIKKHTPLVLSISTVNWSNPIVPLFLLAKKAQKKKLGKKKYAVRRVSFPAGNDQGFAFGNHNLFEKRLIKNFHSWVCANSVGKLSLVVCANIAIHFLLSLKSISACSKRACF